MVSKGSTRPPQVERRQLQEATDGTGALGVWRRDVSGRCPVWGPPPTGCTSVVCGLSCPFLAFLVTGNFSFIFSLKTTGNQLLTPLHTYSWHSLGAVVFWPLSGRDNWSLSSQFSLWKEV